MAIDGIRSASASRLRTASDTSVNGTTAVVWAIFLVVEAQNDLAQGIGMGCNFGMEAAAQRMLKQAISERREAIADLQKELEEEPRGSSEGRLKGLAAAAC